MSWNELNSAVGTPGYCGSANGDSDKGLTWEQFPDAIAGKVDSHGLHNV